jgi:hypothetical protein
MDAELLVDDQIAQGKSLIEQLIKDNFNVSVAFWVKATDDGSWQLHIASPDVNEEKPSEAYQKVYNSLDTISSGTISALDINLINGQNPNAQAAIEYRNRVHARKDVRYYGKKLGNLAVKEAYIYQELEIPVRQAFLVTYVRQGHSNEWKASTKNSIAAIKRQEPYRTQLHSGWTPKQKTKSLPTSSSWWRSARGLTNQQSLPIRL